MNKPVAKLEPESEVSLDPLAKLRDPFPPNQVSKLPKETKAQKEEREKDRSKGINCNICGGWHHKNTIHLDYVGHAALTDRLLDVDPLWSWEPVAFRDGLPAFDQTGGLWIKLTVCGVTRLGYGHAAGKPNMDPGAREKEVIGDALRNAAMRFGAALDLWHKGDLHAHEEEPTPSLEERAVAHLKACAIDRATFKDGWEKNKAGWEAALDRAAYARVVAEMKRLAATLPAEPEPPKEEPAADDFGLADDEIPF
ncbi:hypothetical protein [Phenylobacterium sp. J367]|uniref:hypothetical protein n=1 Tax=Phenylobacterium sp. J367 TaxID=2898435 RepID=UPI0021511F63|nr:hypothetical protein [Phenylobacterium sp. J367]MCR5876969.1 hypothetical protein [Phenylobacterium sp. J367]MCR5877037.1 hypothetical protein [Phenylobacterium sp. J367]